MATAPQVPAWTTEPTAPQADESPLPRDQLSTILADMMARIRGEDPTTDGFRLYEFINPEALDALHEHSQRHEESTWELELETNDARVTIRSDWFIRVRRKA